jgi:hypothetical protein
MNDAVQRLERFLARSQLTITLYWISGTFALFAAEGLKFIDPKSMPNETILTITSVIIYFWFNRSRPQTPVDTTGDRNGTTSKATTVTTTVSTPAGSLPVAGDHSA